MKARKMPKESEVPPPVKANLAVSTPSTNPSGAAQPVTVDRGVEAHHPLAWL
jgi:hypothetical protein